MTTSDSQKFAKRLKQLRTSYGWSQRDLAREFRVTPGAVALWENGSRKVSGPISKLIEFYEANLDLNFTHTLFPKQVGAND